MPGAVPGADLLLQAGSYHWHTMKQAYIIVIHMYIYIYIQMVSFRLLEQTCFLQIISCRRRTYYNPQPNFETSNADAAESEIRAKMPNSLREASEAVIRLLTTWLQNKFSVGQKMQLRLVPVAFRTCFLCFFFTLCALVVCFCCFRWLKKANLWRRYCPYTWNRLLFWSSVCYFSTFKHTVYQTSAVEYECFSCWCSTGLPIESNPKPLLFVVLLVSPFLKVSSWMLCNFVSGTEKAATLSHRYRPQTRNRFHKKHNSLMSILCATITFFL